MCRYFVFKFLELVISIYKVDLETPISEHVEDLFYTMDDVFGSSFVSCTECVLFAFADAIKSLSCIEFNLG